MEYQPGKVEAIAYGRPSSSSKGEGSVEVARHKIETSGKAVKLVAEPDNNQWHADGMDLQHVRVYAVDSKGRRVYNAQQELSFSVEGDARIVAVTNGDINSDELNCTDHRRLWNGSAMVILRAGRKGGDVTLTTCADGFKPLKTKLNL